MHRSTSTIVVFSLILVLLTTPFVTSPTSCSPASPFALFKPLSEKRLDETNELWNCMLCNMPEELSCSADANVCKISNYMEMANTHTNPIFINGQIFKARALMKEVVEELGMDCMNATTFEQDANDTFVKMGPDEAFNIQLEENPSTGYAWEMTIPDGLILVNDKFIPPHISYDIVGAGGTHVWSFRTSDPGIYNIRAVYKRSWEQQCIDDKTFELTITVE